MEQGSCASPCGFDRTLGGGAHHMFDFGEDLFD
jgi:hypothetical protein